MDDFINKQKRANTNKKTGNDRNNLFHQLEGNGMTN